MQGAEYNEVTGASGGARNLSRRGIGTVAATAAVAVALAALAALAFAGLAPPRTAPHKEVLGLVSLPTPDERCHTAQKGEPCYADVVWAMKTGIKTHPEWYKATCQFVKPDSSFEAFQACVYRINQTKCALPCNPTEAIPKESIDGIELKKNTSKDETGMKHPCHTAEKGEPCFEKVMAAIKSGLPDLDKETASFEDFQRVLHKDDDSCAEPCECHTAEEGDNCYVHVSWAITEGIVKHPDWYDDNLTNDSTFEEFQTYLHNDPQISCPRPCHPAGHKTEKPKPPTTPKPKASTSTSTAPASTTAAATNASEGDSSSKALPLPLVNATESSAEATPAPSTSQASGKATTTAPPPPTTKPAASPPPTTVANTTTTARTTTMPPTTTTVPKPTQPPCHTVREGDKCFKDVMYAITQGLRDHPEWYPGLNVRSSFEDFQRVLHDNPKLACPLPCECHTAQPGDKCLGGIRWVLKEGIKSKPNWYPDLTESSRFEQVQARLHEDKDSTCDVPCTPRTWNSPSLFCFSVFRSTGYEFELLKAMLQRGAGIFACDEFAILSDSELNVGAGIETVIIPPCESVGVSKDGTAANTLIFMQAWGAIYDNARYKALDWTIKADPDAVIVPARLRQHLLPHTGASVYIKNCGKFDAPGWPMMFGAVEAISREAIETYFSGDPSGAQRCRDELDWQAWGEDLFMANCLDMLGVGNAADLALVGDGVCTGADCNDGSKAAYHPFKSEEAWVGCWTAAANSR